MLKNLVKKINMQNVHFALTLATLALCVAILVKMETKQVKEEGYVENSDTKEEFTNNDCCC